MTLLDIAQGMKGRLRDGYSAKSAGVTAEGGAVEYGTAVGDSSGGYVTILMDGAPTDDPNYPSAFYYEVETDAPVTDNARVAYIRQDGYGKAVALETLSTIAQGADAIATATNQHFWADTNGVHVSTDDDDPTGAQNIVMNSAGVLLREGSDYLAAFTPSAVAFYDGSGNNASNITASFGSSGATVGYAADANVAVTPGKVAVNGGGDEFVSLGAEYYSGGTFTGGGQITFAESSGNPSWITGTSGGGIEIKTSDNGGVVDIWADDADTAAGHYKKTHVSIGGAVNYGAPSDIALSIQADKNGGTNEDVLSLQFDGALTLAKPLGILSGGTSQTGTEYENTVANIITASSGVTVSAARFAVWGKAAMLQLNLSRSSATANGGTFTVGTVTSGHRPMYLAGGTGSSLNGELATNGSLTVRNVSGSQIAANTTVYISFTYLLP